MLGGASTVIPAAVMASRDYFFVQQARRFYGIILGVAGRETLPMGLARQISNIKALRRHVY